MQMMQGGKVNPQNLMQMMGNNPMMQQAQQMMNSGGDPKEIAMNLAKQKGMSEDQLKQMAQQFGIKL